MKLEPKGKQIRCAIDKMTRKEDRISMYDDQATNKIKPDIYQSASQGSPMVETQGWSSKASYGPGSYHHENTIMNAEEKEHAHSHRANFAYPSIYPTTMSLRMWPVHLEQVNLYHRRHRSTHLPAWHRDVARNPRVVPRRVRRYMALSARAIRACTEDWSWSGNIDQIEIHFRLGRKLTIHFCRYWRTFLGFSVF